MGKLKVMKVARKIKGSDKKIVKKFISKSISGAKEARGVSKKLFKKARKLKY